MNSRNWDLLIGSATCALGIVGYTVIVPLGIVQPGGIDIAALAPDFWPKLVMIGLCIAGAIVLFQGVYPRAQQSQQEDTDLGLGTLAAALKLAIVIVTMFVYYFAISAVGIVLASVAVLLLLMWLGGEKRVSLLAAVAVLLPVALYYFFTRVANVPLPLGLFTS